MNAFINYFIEANLGLVFFMSLYCLWLRHENQFSVNRFFLLTGIFLSLLFPLLRFNSLASAGVIPSISELVPSYWLPEVTIVTAGHTTVLESALPVWRILEWTYFLVVCVLSLLFFVRLANIFQLFRRTDKYRWQDCVISESDEALPTFSFFKFIFIGQVRQFESFEKEEILRHEEVHVRKLHSIDTLLVNLLGIVFWFNPVILTYKKSLAELHEFEADAYSAGNHDVNLYCRLLAKVSLQSSGLSLVNYFNNSLTLKRIAMLKTIKKKIAPWKAIALMGAIPLFFFAVSCQDQVISDLKEVGKNSATAGILPSEVKAQLDLIQNQNPGKKYIVIQMNDEGTKTMEKLKSSNAKTLSQFPTMAVINTSKNSDGDGFTYVILEDGSQTGLISNVTASADSVHSIVDQMPEYPGGIDGLITYMMKEMKYPEQSAKSNVQGKVFVEFVIDQEGNVIDPRVLKGINDEMNKEALRVVAGLSKWIPGKNKGKVVKVKYVLPINFRLS